MAKKKRIRKKKSARSKKKAAPKKAKVTLKRKKLAKTKKSSARKRAGRPTTIVEKSTAQIRQGVGLSETAGQSGDIQGLSDVEDVDSESVRELAEEGQDYEAEIVDAIENAPDADVSEVKTREVPEDDVPEEYRNQ
jgi:hypothetical protein